jgi:dinuclear metal center YbgI/SA1388 family protein
LGGTPLFRIVEIADRLFPFEEAESWDNCGLQIGDPARLIRSVAFSLDPTPQTVRFASSHSCDLLVTHHPLFIEPIQRISTESLTGRTILEAARLGVDILSLHTNLDAAPGGLNDHLAARLGLLEVSVPYPARCARIGNLPTSLRVSALGRKVAADFEIEHVRVIADEDRDVKRIFCASGSGMDYLDEARRHEADLILTGDVRYHAARQAIEMGIPVIDAGHYGLEKTAVGLLGASFRNEFRIMGLAIDCIECDLEREPFTVLS